MLRYQSRRHRCLMDVSEQALADAAEEEIRPKFRVARQVLEDPMLHSLWEARHAKLIRPVAKYGRRVPQILALRGIEAGLIHRTALIDYIRRNRIRGHGRNKLFRLFYGPRDSISSMVAEHRQYLLAASSQISTDYIIDVMNDPVSTSLLDVYRSLYQDYFELYCLMVTTDDAIMADVLRLSVQDARKRASAVREHLKSVKPRKGYANFERQVLLARIRRYPMSNYMVG